MAAAKAGLRPQQDCSHGTTAVAERLQLWHDCGHDNLSHGKIVAMAQLQPWYNCGHGKTVVMQLWQVCNHGMTVAMAQLQPQYHYSHGTAPCGMGTIA